MERKPLRLKLNRSEEERRDLELAQTGDREAYGRLVRLHFGGVYGLLFRLVGSPEDAEDLSQETFVRGWGALGAVQAGSSLRPWLTRIAVNLFYDHLRRRGRGAAVVELDPIAHEPSGREPEPLDQLQSRESQAVVAAAIERLPERLQAAVIMRVVEGRDYEEIAQVMGLKTATIRTHVWQGRRLLMSLLRPWLGDSYEGRDGAGKSGGDQ